VASDGVTPVLVARHVSKAFGGERALDDAAITVDAAEVHGLLGENGSGKSTLIRILAGYHAPAEGAELEVRGRPVRLPLRAGEFRGLGMSFVHQDLALIPSLSVAENLRLGELSTERRLHVSWRAERRGAAQAFARFGVSIDPRARVAELRPVEQALLAIVRAVEGLPERGGGLLALDEPTAFLPEAERRRLFELIRRVARAGSGVLLVSHDLGEVLEVTDRVTVLRDGRNVGTAPTAAVTSERLLEMIVGRHLRAETAPRVPPAGSGWISVRDLHGELARGVSLDVHTGEIVGLTGLAGSGFEEVPYLLFGALPCRSGTLTLDGAELSVPGMTPDRALRAGLAFVPADRQRHGSVGSLSIVDNVTLPALGRYGRRLRRRRMLDDTEQLLEDFDVRPRRPTMPYRALSGGNQQKAHIAKWLHMRPSLLLLDEPTVGVDVGARQQIAGMLRDAARSGVSVLCSSADYEQLAALCNRVVVFAGPTVAAELTGGEVTADRIAQECHRGASDPRPLR
jgi:ribose transport system ATP-binding protein